MRDMNISRLISVQNQILTLDGLQSWSRLDTATLLLVFPKISLSHIHRSDSPRAATS